MARENQRLQVGLIICIMLIVVLLTTTFFGFRSANELSVRLVASNQKANEAESALRQMGLQKQYLMYMVGAGSQKLDALEQAGLTLPDDLKKVKDQFLQDMKQYGAGLPVDEQTYPSVCNNLVTSIRQANEQLAAANATVAQVRSDLDRNVQELTKRVQDAEAAQKKATDELQMALRTFDADRQKFLSQTQEHLKTINDLSQKLAETQAASQKLEKELRQQIDALEALNRRLKQEADANKKESYEVPDGKIVTVNQTERYVWINVGQADGLRPQTSFAVFPEDVASVESATPKARIEVTRVLDAHLAEARIVDDSLKTPIIRNDLIFSPVWRPGQKVHIALAGYMDVNRDGSSDRDLVRNLILASGGVIDAELKDDGTMTGRVDVGTRYLVLGERPNERDNAEMQRNFTEMTRDASLYGVQQIDVNELLYRMGWKPEIRTVHLGRGASDSVNEAGAFRPRRPEAPMPQPRGASGGAY